MAFARSVFGGRPVSKPNLAPRSPSPYSTMGGRPHRLGLGKSYFCIFCAGVPHKPSNFQPFLTHGFVVPEFGRGALEHDAAVAHHVDTMRYPHCDREFLL